MNAQQRVWYCLQTSFWLPQISNFTLMIC